MKRAALVLLAALATAAHAVDVRLRGATPEVETAIRTALKTFETEGITFELKTDGGPTFRLGSSVPFGPDVASRSLTRGAEQIIEINPQSPVPLAHVYRREVARVLGLTASATPQDVRARYGGADLNGDGRVDLADFAILSANYGQSRAGLRGDLNRDGKVDAEDVRIFSTFYQLP